ncbi:MAG: hypothetical protein AB9903_35445 [Vulcanimicrobiota bacterium]
MKKEILLLFTICFLFQICFPVNAYEDRNKNSVNGCQDISFDELKMILNYTDIAKIFTYSWGRIAIEAEPSSENTGKFKLSFDNDISNLHGRYELFKKKWCINGKYYRVFSIGQLQNSCFALDDKNGVYQFYPLTDFPDCAAFDAIVKSSLTGPLSGELFYILCLFYIENVSDQGYNFTIIKKLDDIPFNKTHDKWKSIINERMKEIFNPPHVESSFEGYRLSLFVYSERDLCIRKWDFTMKPDGKFKADFQILFIEVY